MKNKNKCSVIDCDKFAIAKGFCNKHWVRNRKYGDPNYVAYKTTCTKSNCNGKHVAHGLCSRHFEQKRREEGYHARHVRSIKTRYTDALRYAKNKNLTWTISFEDYKKLLNNNCTYCNGPLPETKVGLDRKDSFVGYQLENVVPCCRYCNQIKSNIFTFDEFLQFSKTELFKIILSRLHHNLNKPS